MNDSEKAAAADHTPHADQVAEITILPAAQRTLRRVYYRGQPVGRIAQPALIARLTPRQIDTLIRHLLLDGEGDAVVLASELMRKLAAPTEGAHEPAAVGAGAEIAEGLMGYADA